MANYEIKLACIIEVDFVELRHFRVELLAIIQLDLSVMASTKIKPACIIKVYFVLCAYLPTVSIYV